MTLCSSISGAKDQAQPAPDCSLVATVTVGSAPMAHDLVPSVSGKADWPGTFYNSDAAPGKCRHGARCFARFVQKLTGTNRDFTFETGAGIIKALQGNLGLLI